MVEMSLVAPPKTVTCTVELKPAWSVLQSIMVIGKADYMLGFGEWVTQTAAALTEEQRHASSLLFNPLFGTTLPADEHWPDFPAYLAYLEAEDPAVMRDRALKRCCGDKDDDGEIEAPTLEEVLASEEVYLDLVRSHYIQKGMEDEFDRDRHAEAYTLLKDPPALNSRLTAYLRTMWETHLADEWARVEPMLNESVEAFQKFDHSQLDTAETFRAITGRILPEMWHEYFEDVEHITFIPSAHMGPYVGMHTDGKAARVFFGARLPEGVDVKSPALSRSELLVRLSALADDTRLRILELVTGEDELCAQDIMNRLDLSQSATSRHLRQLSATGYLIERRREGAKCYRLNRDRVDDIVEALSDFFS
jgi:DNA-binding transcriptional ArsR family regulator